MADPIRVALPDDAPAWTDSDAAWAGYWRRRAERAEASGVRAPTAPNVVDGLMALVYLYGAHCAEHPDDCEGARERLRAVKEFALGVAGTPARLTAEQVKHAEGVAYTLRDDGDKEAADVIDMLLLAASGAKEWGPTPDCSLFDERALLREVCRIWGEHGAHAEVLRDIIKRSHGVKGPDHG